ncbi:MAG: hypothetical protein WC628_08650 [Candidatus Omnitrophota bacterium]
MRTLIYVSVIHTSADLGSLAEDVTKRGVADLGMEVWRKHQKTVDGFWYALSLYFNYVDERGLKVYQDGMVAEAELGAKIVEEGLRSGSKNYELVDRLLKQGAILVKTEDFNLVKEERDRIITIIQAKSTIQKIAAFIKYKFIKNRLLRKRDKFIAQRINDTLDDGERGVLFIGAVHNVKKWLAKDIQIKEVKDMRKIREYYRLLPFYDKHRERFEELSRYLISKVNEDIT